MAQGSGIEYWMGVSIENEEYQGRFDELRSTHVHIRTLSGALLQRFQLAVYKSSDWTDVGFDDQVTLAAATADPVGFVADLPEHRILDEVQAFPFGNHNVALSPAGTDADQPLASS